MLVPSLGINLGTPNHLPGTRNAAGVQLMVSTGRAHKGRSQPSACSSFSFVHNFRCLPGQELSTNLGSQNFCVFFSEEVWNMIEIKVMWSISVKNWNRHHLHLSFKQTFFFTRIFSTFFSWRQKTAPEKTLCLHRNFFSLSLEKQWQGEKSPKPEFEFWRRCQTLQKLGCLSRLFGNKNVWSAAVAAAAVEAVVVAVVAVVAAVVVVVAVDAEDEQTASMWMRQKIALQDTAKKYFFSWCASQQLLLLAA